MKRLVIILILLPLIFSVQVLAQSAKQYYKAGDEFYKSMKFNEAIDQYEKAIEMDPDYEKAYVRRAMSYSKIGDHINAADDYDRAIVFNEKDAELFYFSGYEWHLQGKNNIALSKLNTAIDMKGNFLEAYQVRSEVNMELEKYDQALEDCKKCLRLKEDEKGYYNLAQVYEKLEMYNEAEQAYIKSIEKNKRVAETHFSLALLQYKRLKYGAASNSINQVLQLEPKKLDGILLQSQILAAQGNYPKAIEVLSMASIDYPDEVLIFLYRGDINALMNQASYSIIDYSRAIEINPDNAEIYYKRAGAYEAIRDYEKALADYEKLLAMSEYDGTAQRLHKLATLRMFELNREENKPRVILKDPVSKSGNTVDIPRELSVINLTGIVEDESDISSLQVNGFTVPVEKTEEGYQFLASVNLSTTDRITIQVSDIYDNAETAIFPIRRTEVEAPVVQMIAPYGSENNILYLDNNDPQIYVEGRVEDESKIASIYVESVLASYIPSDLNPSFTALVNVENKSKLMVLVEDEYGNKSEILYTLNRDAQ
ncbi:MAG: tetratricopeptide repeat protein, partial [Bacteroidota bacterium]